MIFNSIDFGKFWDYEFSYSYLINTASLIYCCTVHFEFLLYCSEFFVRSKERCLVKNLLEPAMYSCILVLYDFLNLCKSSSLNLCINYMDLKKFIKNSLQILIYKKQRPSKQI